MVIRKYFTAMAQNNNEALQILINPDSDDDLFSIQDRWLQTLISAKADGMEMLSLIADKQ